MLSQCNNTDKHEMWKVISSDGFYDQIVNNFSQKCLHFDNENANPKTAFAVWTSCVGVDSQNFRDIADAQRPSWHPVHDLIKSKSNACLSTKINFDSYFRNVKGQMNTTKKQKDLMLRRKDDLLISNTCGEGNNEFFSYVEEVNGDIKLVHSKSGWCVVPKHDRQGSLSLAPCDQGKDMIWQNNVINVSSFRMHNKTLNKCMTLKSKPINSKIEVTATVMNCINTSEQSIDFVQ